MHASLPPPHPPEDLPYNSLQAWGRVGNAGMWLCTPWLQTPRCAPKACLLLSQREPRAFGHEVLAGLSHQLSRGCLCPARLGVSCPPCARTLILFSILLDVLCLSPGLALARCGAVLLFFAGDLLTLTADLIHRAYGNNFFQCANTYVLLMHSCAQISCSES